MAFLCRRLLALAACAAVALGAAGCSPAADDAEQATDDAVEVVADGGDDGEDEDDSVASAAFASGEDVTIAVADVTDEATFYDYDADGVTVQLFAVQASDGSVRVALNTCQVCAGSSKAYFVQRGDAFVCQNCRNSFDVDEVGVEASGCNPVPITEGDYETDGETITVPSSYLAQYADAFENWNG